MDVRPWLAPALCVLLSACNSKPDPRGEALFYGREPLTGRLPADTTPLPQIAVRCVNCHEKDNQSPLGGASGASYAPKLTRAWLSESRVRRGGPASRYDLPAFCAVLRLGVDPAHVIISTLMPRYEMDDASCAALWHYVESR